MSDLISRQAAIEDLINTGINKIWDTADVELWVNGLPSAQPEHNPDDERKIADLHKMVNYLLSQQEQRWIPCSERLPEEEYVLISKKPTKISGNKWSVDIAIRTSDPRSRKIQWRDSGFGVIQDDKVLAWMPLPEPYKENNHEDD